MKNIQNGDLCLAIHCLSKTGQSFEGPHQELLIPAEQLKELIEQLLGRGYTFSLPWDFKRDKLNCVLTFDDGYYNNINFLPLSREYNIPFILFLNSYNILNNQPFIWDIWAENFGSDLPFNVASYRELNKKYIQPHHSKNINNDLRRPFRLDELKDFAQDSRVYLGCHGHHHQPLTNKYKHEWGRDIAENKQFFLDQGLKFVNEYALPAGLFTLGSLAWAKKQFQHIYTISGGFCQLSTPVINRISLINDQLAKRTLMEQIEISTRRSCYAWLRRKKIQFDRLKYAYKG